MTKSIGLRPCACAAILAAGIVSSSSSWAMDAPPTAPVRPVTDQYFGVDVVDNYRYMENLKDPQVQAWMRAQADHTRAVLDALPGRAALLKRIHEWDNQDVFRGSFVRRGQRYFYLSFEPNTQQPKLYYRDGLKGQERLLLDPATLGQGSGTHYAMDSFTPSWDGRYVAYELSSGGSEKSLLHVLEVDSGRTLGEAIDRVDEERVAWRPDNRSFFYFRYPKPTPDMTAAQTVYNARSYVHVVGVGPSGDDDVVVFGRGVSPRVDVPEGQVAYVITAPDSAYAIGVANHNNDNNPSTIFVAPLAGVAGADTPWRKIADVDDGVTEVVPHGDRLYFLSRKGAPNARLLTTPLANADIDHADVIVPSSSSVIDAFSIAREGLYVEERDVATDRLMLVSRDGGQAKPVPTLFEGASYAAVTDPREFGALFGAGGWTHAPVRLSYDPATGVSTDTGLIAPFKIDTSGIVAKDVFAVSYDGTRIPLTILYRKDVRLDGKNPTILYAYGSYGVVDPQTAFRFDLLPWVERGGVYAFAQVRGGGAYGEAWHRGGFMLTKPNTFLDFIACAQYLEDNGYTSPSHLAGHGVSAGGITVGGALTWRPDLFGVILDEVGLSDTLRFETEPNGPPNASEFGSIKTEPGFHGLYAMSPYAHVRDGVAYPATLFVTGFNDPRVSSWHMSKMAARVKAATSSHRPVLLRVDFDAGHGFGSNLDQEESLTADEWSFALWQMGDPAFQPPPK